MEDRGHVGLAKEAQAVAEGADGEPPANGATAESDLETTVAM